MTFRSLLAQMIKPCVYVFSINVLGPGDWAGSYGLCIPLLSPVHQEEFILVAPMFLRLEDYFNTRRECIRLVRAIW